jgi:hypothetical protein
VRSLQLASPFLKPVVHTLHQPFRNLPDGALDPPPSGRLFLDSLYFTFYPVEPPVLDIQTILRAETPGALLNGP